MKMNKKGFTLIEVILVLAIGSLIFAMAFIAYSQASVNRRDTQRRADLGKIASELENFASDNNGSYPVTDGGAGGTYATDFQINYIASLKDPSGSKYVSISSGPGKITYFPKDNGGYDTSAKMCDNSTTIPSGKRDYVVRMMLEKGETCRDSTQ